jgi:hypothetical protein
MIVDDLNVRGFTIAPNKTYPPLIVDANAALTLAVAAQRLQTVARRHTQVNDNVPLFLTYSGIEPDIGPPRILSSQAPVVAPTFPASLLAAQTPAPGCK